MLLSHQSSGVKSYVYLNKILIKLIFINTLQMCISIHLSPYHKYQGFNLREKTTSIWDKNTHNS